MPIKRKTAKKTLILRSMIIAAAAVVMFWGMVTPAFEFPDEQAHLGTAMYLLKEGRLPGYHQPDMTREMYETQSLLGVLRDGHGNNRYTYHPEYRPQYSDSVVGKYEAEIDSFNTSQYRDSYTQVEEAARYPALYYAYIGIFLKLAESGSILTRLFAARLGSLVLAGLMAWVIYQFGFLLFKSRKLAGTLVALTFLQPMFSFLTAGINSDNLHNLLYFYLLYLGLLVLKRGITLRLLILMALTVAADMATKPQGFIAFAFAILVLTIRIVMDRRYKLLFSLLLFTALVAALGWEQIMRYKAFLWLENVKGAEFGAFLQFSLNKLVAQNSVWYWGVFKWLGVVLPPIYWQVANRVVLLSGLGLAVYLYKVIKKKKLVADPVAVAYLLIVTFFYAGVVYWFDWQYHKGWGFSLGIQSRYFFPTIVAHMGLLMTGILTLGWNIRSRVWLRRLLLLLFIWLQLGGLWTLVNSYYDTSSLADFITQVSQYKPAWLKGDWWYLWLGIYFSCLITIFVTLFPRAKNRKKL